MTHACVSCHEILRHSITRCQVSCRVRPDYDPAHRFDDKGKDVARARVPYASTGGRACARAVRLPIGCHHMVWCQTTETVQFNNKMLVGLNACQSCVWSHDDLVASPGSGNNSRPSVRRASASHTSHEITRGSETQWFERPDRRHDKSIRLNKLFQFLSAPWDSTLLQDYTYIRERRESGEFRPIDIEVTRI